MPKSSIVESEKAGESNCCGGESCCQTENETSKAKNEAPKASCGTTPCGTGACGTTNLVCKVKKVIFLVGSKNGAAKSFADQILSYIRAFNPSMEISFVNIETTSIQDVEELFKVNKEVLYVLIMASYPSGFCENFLAYFRESVTDWRIGKDALSETAGLIPILLG